jgi:hypothetical protein
LAGTGADPYNMKLSIRGTDYYKELGVINIAPEKASY